MIGLERCRLDGRTEAGGDRRRGGVGLVGGDAALLDRERRDVADGVDVAQPRDRAVLVDGNKPVALGGQSGRGVADEPRQGHDAIGGNRAAVAQRGAVVAHRRDLGLGQEVDAAVAQQVSDDAGGGGSEEGQRLVLGGGECQLGAYHAVVGDPRCCEQRELVERQRPARPGRDREEHVVDRPRFQICQQRTIVLDVLGAPEREPAGQPLLRDRAGSEHERVVVEFFAIGQRDAMGVGVYARDCVAHVAHAMGLLEPVERKPVRRRVAKRLHDRQRPIHEMVLACYEVDLDLDRLGERPQREHRLDRAHAAAGHDDPRRGSRRAVLFRHGASLVVDAFANAMTRTGHARGVLNGWQSPFDRTRRIAEAPGVADQRGNHARRPHGLGRRSPS